VLELQLAQVAAELGRDPVEAEPEHGQAEVALELSPVAAELGRDPVEAELGRDPVEAVREHGQVEAVLELVRVEAVPVPGHPRARLVLPLGTKSVTAPHRPGLPLLAAEDLAAAAETTREPAAAEAATAWEVADLAAVAVEAVAVAAVAEAEVAEAEAEDADDKQTMGLRKTNEKKTTHYEFVETVRDCLRDR
jgi:hypothetical protein